MPAVFKVLQELNDARGGKINHAKLISGFMRLARDGANEKAKRVSVTALGIESQIAYADEVFQKEPSYPWTEKTGISHEALLSERASRSACWLAPGAQESLKGKRR